MAKYSFEFKMSVVKDYLDGQGGYRYLSEKYGIHHRLVERWVACYRQYGENGLTRSRKQKSYTFEFKLHVVELYLTSELSYQELAIQVGITDPGRITRWVLDYRAAGPEALKPKRKAENEPWTKRRSFVKSRKAIPMNRRNSLSNYRRRILDCGSRMRF